MNKYLLLFTTYLFPLFHELDHETDESVKEATGGNEDGMEVGMEFEVFEFLEQHEHPETTEKQVDEFTPDLLSLPGVGLTNVETLFLELHFLSWQLSDDALQLPLFRQPHSYENTVFKESEDVFVEGEVVLELFYHQFISGLECFELDQHFDDQETIVDQVIEETEKVSEHQ